MIKQKYIVEYSCYDKDCRPIVLDKKMRVTGAISKLHAQSRLEDLLKLKYKNFGYMVVDTCYEDNPLTTIFGDVFGHGKSNPFA